MRWCDYTVALRTLAALSILGTAPASYAQTPDAPIVGAVLSSDVLADLPLSGTPFGAVETLQSEIISDRFTAAGLNVASAPRYGAFLNSWTQTDWRIGDVSVTDPRAGGTALILPTLSFWQTLTLSTASGPLDDPSPALTIRLEPVRPGTRWSRRLDGWFTVPALVAGAASSVAPVDQIRHAQFGTFVASGPISERTGIVAGAAWRSASHEPLGSAALDDRVGSAFAQVVFAPTSTDELRALVWVDRTDTSPSGDATAVHAQGTWENRSSAGTSWRGYGGYTQRRQTASRPRVLTTDTLTADPIAAILDSGSNTTRRWTIGARVSPMFSGLALTLGAELERAAVQLAPNGIAQIQETVASVPARVWTVQSPAADDGRHSTHLSAWMTDRLTAGRAAVDAGLALDMVSASADAASAGISWTTWLPRATGRLKVLDVPSVSLVGGYRRSAYQIPLDMLAVGDPTAPVADVSAWDGVTVGPAFARVGPGSGGAALSSIDPNVDRPNTDEGFIGVEATPVGGLDIGFTWIAKREGSLLQLIDPGVPASAYSTQTAPDPSFIAGSPVGAPTVLVFNRPSGAYGRDRYVLTNRSDTATFRGIELRVRVTRPRWTVIASGAHTRTSVPAAAIGYLPTQNDPDVLGSVLADPNASTADTGQVFADRTTAVKIAAAYRFPGNVHVGAIARYQDGQPFSRVVVVPELTQGTSAVRSYANGGTAFTFTGTFDVRIRKVFTRGSTELAAVADIYNLPNLGNEVSEIVATGPAFRTPVAQQPPRTMTFGVTLKF